MNKLYVVGDLHANAEGERTLLNSKNWPEQKNLDKSDVLIQLGDFGDIWYNKEHKKYKEDKYWQNWWSSRNYSLLVIDGNHDNHDIIQSLPIIDKFDGKVYELETDNGNIYIAKRGEIYNINNKKIFTMGGALSIDKEHRKLGIDYWDKEIPNYKDIENALNNLDKYNWNVDYIMTHTMPDFMISEFIHETKYNQDKFKDLTAILLSEIYNKLEFKEWYCGHFHTNLKVKFPDSDNFIQCLYKTKPQEII